MRTAVITLARGRHSHLRLQVAGLSATPPEDYVVVSLGDDGLAAELIGVPHRLVYLPVAPEAELPLAAARNAGAEAALELGAQLLVFLDVDCIPGPGLLPAYRGAAVRADCEQALLCGPVSYLPPPPAAGYDLNTLSEQADPHSARPVPAPGTVQPGTDRRLFWSLSFALTAANWTRIGGFCTDYVGYGGEDTDFAELAHAAGVELTWVGGAEAYHQYHPVSAPPVQHLTAILRNARVFHDRWGWWPMGGWLDRFAELGLAGYTPDRGWTAR